MLRELTIIVIEDVVWESEWVSLRKCLLEEVLKGRALNREIVPPQSAHLYVDN